MATRYASAVSKPLGMSISLHSNPELVSTIPDVVPQQAAISRTPIAYGDFHGRPPDAKRQAARIYSTCFARIMALWPRRPDDGARAPLPCAVYSQSDGRKLRRDAGHGTAHGPLLKYCTCTVDTTVERICIRPGCVLAPHWALRTRRLQEETARNRDLPSAIHTARTPATQTPQRGLATSVMLGGV